jgi:predicted flavoprotein YhiN
MTLSLADRDLLQRNTVRDIMAKPGMKARISNMTDFHVTKHNDMLAALVVAEGTEDAFLKSAMDQFVMAAKMADADKFTEAKEKFGTYPRVMFVDANLVIDTFMPTITKFILGEKRPSLLGRIFGRK